MDPATHTATWTATDEHANARLDAFLAAQLPWRSRRSLVALVLRGAARVNGQTVKKAHRLALGDRVELELPAADIPHEAIAATELPIIFEDDELVVVDKPAGLAVHPASTCPHVHALARLHLRYTTERPDPDAEPSVIHRLDRGTSGVVAFARRREHVAYYTRQFEQRTVGKHYLAIVQGHPADTGRIEAPLQVIDGRPVTVHPDGKPSRTDYQVVAKAGGLALVSIALHTGRKHQIRVHFAARGLPLLYDDVYGPRAGPEGWPDEARPMLHAAQLTLEHRRHGPMTFQAPMPADMAAVWADAGGVAP